MQQKNERSFFFSSDLQILYKTKKKRKNKDPHFQKKCRATTMELQKH
jgi:hypothetical protein